MPLASTRTHLRASYATIVALTARGLLLVAGLFAGTPAAYAIQAPNSDTVATSLGHATAVRRKSPIHIDGVLDEPDWRAAPVAGGFTESYPDAGATPKDRTEVRVLYDDEAIYVGVRMSDSQPSAIAAPLTRRDDYGLYSDWVHVIIGPYHDRRTAYRFAVNPAGVKRDVLEYNDLGEDENWDAVWSVAVTTDSSGWTAEYRIPLSQLSVPRVGTGEARLFDFQVMRDVARRQERSTLFPWSHQSPGFVSSFGVLDGINGVAGPRRVELVPYVSSQLTRAPGIGGNPFFRRNDAHLSAGSDVRVGLGAGMTLSATLNPDFGQAEVDPAFVNLSDAETFLPEHRGFFLDGSDVFQFGNTRGRFDFSDQFFYYSRRIGRAPHRVIDDPSIAYVDAPSLTRVLAAAKVAGRQGAWTLGLLDAMTEEERAEYETVAGRRASAAVEPRTNYFVARAKHASSSGNTILGGLVTATSRSMHDPALADTLRSGAEVMGLDLEQYWRSHTVSLTGYVAASDVHGTSRAIAQTQRSSARYYGRPDASYARLDTTRTSLGGYMGHFALAREGPWYGSVLYKFASPGFEVNDLGFQPRVDFRNASIAGGYRNEEQGRLFRSFELLTSTSSVWNFGGTPIRRYINLNGYGTLQNFWGVSEEMTYRPRSYDDFFTRGGPRVRFPGLFDFVTHVSTDPRRAVIGILTTDYTRFNAGGQTVRHALELDLRPRSYLHLMISPTFTRQRSAAQYVETVVDPTATNTFGSRYLYASLAQTTLSLDTRIEWTFAPTLSLQLYAQPFTSSGRYDSFKQLHAPTKYEFDRFGTDIGTIARSEDGSYHIDPDGLGAAPPFSVSNPDFNIHSLHGDAVLRWEYKPGSTLFVVWEQQRNGSSESSDFELSRDVGAVFRARPTNVLLVKISYWLSR